MRKAILGVLGSALLLHGCASGPTVDRSSGKLSPPSLQAQIEQEIQALMTGEGAVLVGLGTVSPGEVHTVRPGDTATAILRRAGAPQSVIQSLPKADLLALSKLQPGHRLMLLKKGESFTGVGLDTGNGWRVALQSEQPYQLRDNVTFEPPQYTLADIPLRSTLSATLAQDGFLSPQTQAAFKSILARSFNDSRLPAEGWLRLRMVQPMFQGAPLGDPVLASAALADMVANESHFVIGIERPGQPITYYDGYGSRLAPSWLSRPIMGDYRITSGFDPARRHPVTGRVRPHNGKDFAATPGTPVLAASDATVTYAGRLSSWGNLIVLQHDGGIETRYAHLSSIEGIAPGDWVQQGAIIGRVGSTGLSSGPHLHFEVHVNGRPQNPATFMPEHHVASADAPLSPEMLNDIQAIIDLEERSLAFLPAPGRSLSDFVPELWGVGGPLAEDEDISPFLPCSPCALPLKWAD